ncbi:MAG: hypothetical protein ACRC8A_10155 [Microcoleaceae cyanobacterium]
MPTTMQSASEPTVSYQVQCLELPLAVYLEVAAHLRQIPGVETGLNPRSNFSQGSFNYLQSQIESLWIRYAAAQALTIQPKVDQILNYYGDRHGVWQVIRE